MANYPSMIPSLKARLQGSLPRYMIPTVYIPLEDFHVSKTNKTDRAKLRELAVKMRQIDTTAGKSEVKRQPCNDGERRIQKLVAKALDLSLDSVGLDDNFFMLGGDSALAIKLVSAARAEALHLSVKEILLQPRLAGLVPTETGHELASDNSIITTSTSTRHPCELLGIKDPQEFIAETIAPKTAFTAADILDVLPTTDFQADLIRTWPFTYFLVTMRGPLDEARLRAACKTLVERHEIYRTVFVSHGSDILQVILKEAEVPFFEFPFDNDEDLFTVCESACPADLDQGLSTGQLLTQFKLFYQEDPNYHILAVRLSHPQYDGFCMPLLWKDLAAIYGASELEPVTNFSAYVHHLHAQGTSKAVGFWSQTLKGSPPLARLDHLSLGATEQAQATLIELTREVPLPCPPTTITIATPMKAAAALLMMRLTNVPDLVFGQVVSGRNMALEGIETILGVCANIVPVRVQFQPKWLAIDLLEQVQAQQIDALEHETLGLHEIERDCTQWPEGAHLGCLIQHQNLDLRPEFSLSEVQSTTRIFGGSFKREFLHICTLPRGKRMVVQLFAPSGLLSETHCERVLDQLCDTAFWLAENPYHLLSECGSSMILN